MPDGARLVELNAVLRKACSQDPRERYSSAEALPADLELLQRGRSVRQQRARQRRWALVRTEALAALEQSYGHRFERLVNSDYGGLRTDPAWDDLQGDPRFEALCQKVGLGQGQWPK